MPWTGMRFPMPLDRVPVMNLSVNQEYAPPGTQKWMSETVALLQRIVDESEKLGPEKA